MPKIQVDTNPQDNASTTRRQKSIENRDRLAREARERRQQTIIGIIVVLIIFAMLAAVGVTAYQAAYVKPQEQTKQAQQAQESLDKLSAKERPRRTNEQGGILISKQGYGKAVANAPTIALYSDPLCPGCGNFNRNVDKYLIQMVHAGQINLEIHPMSFLDPLSTDNYSTRVTGAIAYIAEKDDNPEHLLNFINNIFTEEFQPQEGEGYKPVSNEKLIEQAKKAGVDKDIADQAFNRRYLKWQLLMNKTTPNRKELWNVSGVNKGSMTTPTTTINGVLLDMNVVNEKKIDVLDAVLRSIGLDKNQIGVEGHMPKITDKDKPINL